MLVNAVTPGTPPSTFGFELSLAALLFAAASFARAADTCNLLTTAEISAATGDAVTNTAPGPSNCIWSGKASRVYLTIRDGSGWASFKSMVIGGGKGTATNTSAGGKGATGAAGGKAEDGLGGELTVNSTPGRGSAFTLYLHSKQFVFNRDPAP